MGYQISNIHRSRRNVIYHLLLSLVLLAVAIFLTVIQPRIWWVILVCLLIIVSSFIPSLNKVHEIEAIIIDEKGIQRGLKSYPWPRIDHCYYTSRHGSMYFLPERMLVIVLKKGERVVWKLNGYSFKKKELVAAINQYSEKQICHMTGNDIKHESIHFLFSVLVIILFMLILFLLLYPGR